MPRSVKLIELGSKSIRFANWRIDKALSARRSRNHLVLVFIVVHRFGVVYAVDIYCTHDAGSLTV